MIFDFNKDKTTLETDIVLTFSEEVDLGGIPSIQIEKTSTDIGRSRERSRIHSSNQIAGLGSDKITINTLKDLEPATTYQLSLDGLVISLTILLKFILTLLLQKMFQF